MDQPVGWTAVCQEKTPNMLTSQATEFLYYFSITNASASVLPHKFISDIHCLFTCWLFIQIICSWKHELPSEELILEHTSFVVCLPTVGAERGPDDQTEWIRLVHQKMCWSLFSTGTMEQWSPTGVIFFLPNPVFRLDLHTYRCCYSFVLQPSR